MVCLLFSAAWIAANAPGTLDVQLRPAQQIAGLTAAEVVQANAAANRVVDVLRRTPALARPAAGQCVRIFSYVVPNAEPVMAASVTVGSPAVVRAQCANTSDAQLTVRVNDFAVWRQAAVPGPAGAPLGDGRGAFYLNPRCEKPACVAVARQGVPVLVPVTKEEHLAALVRAWHKVIEQAECFSDEEGGHSGSSESARRTLEQARSALATVQREAWSLSTGGRRSPACWMSGAPAQLTSGAAGCLPEQRIFRLNPRYFETARKAAIQLITVESSQPEGLHWIPAIDFAALAALVQ